MHQKGRLALQSRHDFALKLALRYKASRERHVRRSVQRTLPGQDHLVPLLNTYWVPRVPRAANLLCRFTAICSASFR